MLKGPAKDTRNKILSNECGHLTQVNTYGVRSTDTTDFINCYEVPQDSDVTYATDVLKYKPIKDEKHIVSITVGGDHLTYLYDVGPPTANLIETKVLLNSTISVARHGARFMLADIKDYFLVMLMARADL